MCCYVEADCPSLPEVGLVFVDMALTWLFKHFILFCTFSQKLKKIFSKFRRTDNVKNTIDSMVYVIN